MEEPRAKLKTKMEKAVEKRTETITLRQMRAEDPDYEKTEKVRLCVTLDKDLSQKVHARAKRLRLTFSAYLNTLLSQQPNL